MARRKTVSGESRREVGTLDMAIVFFGSCDDDAEGGRRGGAATRFIAEVGVHTTRWPFPSRLGYPTRTGLVET
jgi:hypothetical protein